MGHYVKLVKYVKLVNIVKTIKNIKSVKSFMGHYGSWISFYSVSHTEYLVVLPSPVLCKIPSLSIKAKSLLLVSLVAPVIS